MSQTETTTRSSARCSPSAVAASARPWTTSSTASRRLALAHHATDTAVAGASQIRRADRHAAIDQVGDRLRGQQAQRHEQDQVEGTLRPAAARPPAPGRRPPAR